MAFPQTLIRRPVVQPVFQSDLQPINPNAAAMSTMGLAARNKSMYGGTGVMSSGGPPIQMGVSPADAIMHTGQAGLSGAIDPTTGLPLTTDQAALRGGFQMGDYASSGVGFGTQGYQGTWRPGGYNFGQGTRRPTARTSDEYYSMRDRAIGNPLEQLKRYGPNRGMGGSLLSKIMSEAQPQSGGIDTKTNSDGSTSMTPHWLSDGEQSPLNAPPNAIESDDSHTLARGPRSLIMNSKYGSGRSSLDPTNEVGGFTPVMEGEQGNGDPQTQSEPASDIPDNVGLLPPQHSVLAPSQAFPRSLLPKIGMTNKVGAPIVMPNTPPISYKRGVGQTPLQKVLGTLKAAGSGAMLGYDNYISPLDPYNIMMDLPGRFRNFWGALNTPSS